MSEDVPDPNTQALLNCAYLDLLEPAFPNISRLPIDLSFLTDPSLRKLLSLLKFGIPVHTFQPEPLALYDRISQVYYDYLYRHSLKAKQTPDHSHVSFQPPLQVEVPKALPESSEKVPSRKKINYLDLARFIQNFTPEMEGSVNQEVIRQGQRFDSWQRKEVTVPAFKETPKKPKEKYEKNERSDFTFREKVLKADNTINITIGKNISREVNQMKRLLIKRAENNRLLDDSIILTDLEKVEAEINFILNRITEEYFEQFLDELHPYAMHELYSLVLSEKIIEKILEEHNFIKLYSKLIKRLCKINVEYGDKTIKFKAIFIQKLQISFYKLIRKREWTDREQLYKKQLLGFSFFVGQLIHCKILSKFAFPDIFFELISSFIHQYRQNQGNKNFYHETYVECIIKIIETMGDKYDGLLSKSPHSKVNQVCETILANFDNEQANFEHVCDFIEVLKELNRRMPSQRFKISFLLQDFRCSKALKREVSKEENNQYEIVKSVLAIDHSNAHDVRKIPGMISVCDPRIIMKDYYFQFAQGNAKHVAKNLETFKIFMELPGMLDAALWALKDNLSGLYMIDSDFPFLAEGLAKIMKQVCDHRRCEWRELELSDPDEDISEFIERIENKYFKMILED